MNNKYSLAAAAFFISASSVFAGTLDVPAAADWGGFYGGGMVSFSGGDIAPVFDGVPSSFFPLNNTTLYGGFAGYNIQRGAMVFGAELAVTSDGINHSVAVGSHYDAIFDLKARAGYSFNNVMAYAVAGGTFANYDDSGVDQYASSGFVYGVGVDVMIGANLFVGAEFLVRALSGAGEDIDVTGISHDGNIQSAQVRVGWHF